MKRLADRLLSFLLSRRSMFAFNRMLLMAAFRGLGIGNWRSNRGERLFLRNLARRMPKDAVILDIGANRGAYAAMVRAAFPKARIYAFEPHPASLAELERVASRLDFEAIRSACGAEEGSLTLYDYPGGKGSSHASAFREVIEEHHMAQSHGHSEAIEVPVTTVDRFLQERGIERVDLMKVDVEGLDLSVLNGAKGAFSAGRIRMVQFEFSELDVHARTFFQDFKQFLNEFEIYRILDNGALLPLADHPVPLVEIFHYQNLVAKRRG